jgi:catechol 2,3-dioxygenase-like lactoylglutathione lyase family enzyme
MKERWAAMFKRIDHIEIVTDKPDQTAVFYTDVLGFSVKGRERVDLSGGAAVNLAYLDLGGTVVELVSFEGIPVDPMPRLEHLGYRMIALEVEDMQKASDYLKGKGVEIVWGPMVTDTYARAEIRDPNGYGIELRQWFKVRDVAAGRRRMPS